MSQNNVDEPETSCTAVCSAVGIVLCPAMCTYIVLYTGSVLLKLLRHFI